MAKPIRLPLPEPDDPIFSEGVRISSAVVAKKSPEPPPGREGEARDIATSEGKQKTRKRAGRGTQP